MTEALPTARALGLARCHACGLLAKISPDGGATRCRRCGSAVHLRRPNSINRCWALLITGVILYIPANMLPIMLTSILGKTEGSTIMQGVRYFLSDGEWYIALVIFTASICVPLFKMSALVYLLLSVQKGSNRLEVERTRIYRFVEFVGRWSMIDVFVVSIMVALVQLGSLATIAAGPGIIYFCAVVIVTMLAAGEFDPRLIWDHHQSDE